MSELFRPGIHEAEGFRVPERPLGKVSDFVVDQLPVELERIRNGGNVDRIVDVTGKIIEDIDLNKVNEAIKNPKHLDIAGLDLKMIEAGIVHNNGRAPDNLAQMVDRFSNLSNQPESISYEEIILINPLGDPRTFTTCEIGKSETDFYKGHKLIEKELDGTIVNCFDSISFLYEKGEKGIGDAIERLNHAAENMGNIVDLMKSIGMKMPKEHFAVFRQYFNSHPTREKDGENLKGPSGTFTAGLPVVEFLLAGENMPDKHSRHLEENRIYFPRRGRSQIDEAREISKSGFSIVSLSRKLGKPEMLSQGIESVSAQIRLFRGVHHKGVKYQIPDAVSGNTYGTGGEKDPGTFLRERMKIRHTENSS